MRKIQLLKSSSLSESSHLIHKLAASCLSIPKLNMVRFPSVVIKLSGYFFSRRLRRASICELFQGATNSNAGLDAQHFSPPLILLTQLCGTLLTYAICHGSSDQKRVA